MVGIAAADRLSLKPVNTNLLHFHVDLGAGSLLVKFVFVSLR